MPRQDETVPSSEAPTEPFPRFMNLPPELHILIANFLIFPDLVHLKLTCAYFNDLIPPLSHHELLQAELTDFALARDVYTCRYCLRLRPAAKFADRMLRRGRGRYGRDAERRFCVECGLMPRSGTAREFAVGMKGGVCKGIAICEKCWEERLIRERAFP
ncbi:hypothetical protein APSETT444_008650 [Aspergillus pseudonomiae]